jgi:hypothetical protein
MKNTPSSHPVVLVSQYSYVKRTNIMWYQWGSSTPNETTSGYGKSPILDDLPIIHGGFP